ncbi:MAG: N(4)-(beta-N-acetylglucosaminyl)-L-asparaginase [Chloroflexota bacterium]
MTNPTIVSSENGRKGAEAAMISLRDGGSALEAVEIACRITEDDPEEHSVGYSGLPNLIGEVELDASIMDGQTLHSGAVAGVRGYGNPITLARMVMEELPHVLLVGRGAEAFAQEMGQVRANQLTTTALDRWRERYDIQGINPNAIENLRQIAWELTGPMVLFDRKTSESEPVETIEKDDTLGTVNFLAIDQQGNMASGVSTSGIGWKYPGRVGDSPIIGAGNYCDNRYGAAACTGAGELAIRVSTARSLVLYLKMGMSLAEAGQEALQDLQILADPLWEKRWYMNIVTLTPDGQHAGFTTREAAGYLYYTSEMDEPMLAARTVLGQ